MINNNKKQSPDSENRYMPLGLGGCVYICLLNNTNTCFSTVPMIERYYFYYSALYYVIVYLTLMFHDMFNE